MATKKVNIQELKEKVLKNNKIILRQFLDKLGESLIEKVEGNKNIKVNPFNMNFKVFHRNFSHHFSQIFKKESKQIICTKHLYSILNKYKLLSENADTKILNQAVQQMKEFINSIKVSDQQKKLNKPLVLVKNKFEIKKIKEGVSVFFIKENNTFKVNFKKKLILKDSKVISKRELNTYLNLLEKGLKNIIK